jgi:septal ring factor EnvC (AmiA/AmiB activator)
VRAAIPVAALLLAALAFRAFAADDRELQELRNAIYESRERVGSHERQEREIFTLLEQSDRLCAALSAAVRNAETEATQARDASIRLEEQRSLAAERLEANRRQLSKRAVALYKAGEVGPLRFVFGSSTIPELMSRISALRTFVEFDAALVDRFRSARDRFARLQAEAKTAAEAHAAAAETLAARSSELFAEREARRRLLARARSDRTRERALLVELEKAARALEETLTALGEDAAGNDEWLVGRGFAERRGTLRAPIPTRIRLGFGKVVDEEFRTETYRKGVEFAANGGESVRAVAPGVVRFAGWFRGYGKLVILDQGDHYFSVMGHLDELFVAVGDSVNEGDTIGSAGDTGSLSGPSLYFELRRGSQPLDPGEWLRLRRSARAN